MERIIIIKGRMIISLGKILLAILILALVGTIPVWLHNRSGRYARIGEVGPVR